MRRLVSEAGTAAIVAANKVPFTVNAGDFRGGAKPIFSAEGLAGTETVTLYHGSGTNATLVRDGVLTGNSDASVTFESAGEYSYIKDLTASELDLYVTNNT